MKALGWLLVAFGVVYVVGGTWALHHWNVEMATWAGMADLLPLDAVPITLRFGWAFAVLAPAAGLMHLGRFLRRRRLEPGQA